MCEKLLFTLFLLFIGANLKKKIKIKIKKKGKEGENVQTWLQKRESKLHLRLISKLDLETQGSQ